MYNLIEKTKNVLRLGKKVFYLYTTSLIRKNDTLWIFGSWFGEKYADNPKYLYEYCLSQGMNVVWFTRSPKVYDELKASSRPVILSGTKEANRLASIAKYDVYCTNECDTDALHTGGAIHINLFHGIPLKKFGYDDKVTDNLDNSKVRLKDKMYSFPNRKTYTFPTSATVAKIHKSAFKVDEDHIIQIGQARNDCFFDGSLPLVKYSDIHYNKVILYMPTHRNEGKSEIAIDKIFDLKKLNHFCRDNDLLFIVKKHFYHKHETADFSAYSNFIDLSSGVYDTQEMLFNADILITDYSSCYIDYLLLNRPVIFYNYDMNEYLMNDREMYLDYNNVTPGPMVQSCDALLAAISSALKMDVKTDANYLRVKNMYYSPSNQSAVCPQLVDAILKLN